MYVCMCVCMICMCVCMICMYICMYVIYICMYVMCVCAYASIYKCMCIDVCMDGTSFHEWGQLEQCVSSPFVYSSIGSMYYH